MKHLLTILCLALVFISNNQAATLTVNNTNPTIGQYLTVQAAVDAAASGDVILIQGSQTTYPDFVLPADKALTLRGPGWKPVYRQSPMPARMNNIYLAFKAHDITIEGLYFGSLLMQGVSDNGWNVYQYNIKVQFCYFEFLGIARGNRNFTIENNNFGYIGGGNDTTTNILIRNNFIRDGIRSFRNSSGVLVDHNLFVGGYYALHDLDAILIVNNIFYYAYVGHGTVARCILSNNLTYHSNNNPSNTQFYNDLNSPNRNAIAESNKQGVDPLFMYGNDWRGPEIQLDYRLQPTSPAKNAATDGKDIGIINISALSKTGEVAPAVRTFNIANPVTTPSGNLIIKMTASKARLDKD